MAWKWVKLFIAGDRYLFRALFGVAGITDVAFDGFPISSCWWVWSWEDFIDIASKDATSEFVAFCSAFCLRNDSQDVG